MIFGGRFFAVHAEKFSDMPVNAVNVDIALTAINLVADNELEINYVYTVDYTDNVGRLVIEGVVFDRLESAEEARRIAEAFNTDKKQVPREYISNVVNAINYICSVNSPLPLKIVELAPPILPPQINLEEETNRAEQQDVFV
ncbi:MAG: hypothetical protein N3E37_04315 [Candidatus Micrarchaeota archaeon]|nr:hypothetical protein [Candidatus Micrarchaeota archaeon]